MNYIRRPYIFFLLVVIANVQCLALDHIILRNGQEFDVKLHQITNEAISYSINGDKHVARESVPSKDVYMVYIEKQGNIYLTPDGKRVSGEANRVDPKKYDVIYLVSGAEIGAKNIKLTEDAVVYSPIKKGGLLSNIIGTSEAEGIQTLPNQEVFMIRYKSGMIDVITPIDKVDEPQEEIKEEEPHTPQYIVLFHAVTKGQNLKSIADIYNVTVTQIIEWNDLPAKSKPTAPLTVGMQLMIYQPKQN